MRAIRALAGVVGLALLLGGVPVVLWTVGQDFIPDRFPSIGEIWDTLWAQDTGRIVIGFILLIGAIAWLIMLIGFLLELPYALQRRRRAQVRGFGWAQRTASALLFMIITGTASGLLAPAANAGTLPALQPISASSAASAPVNVASPIRTAPTVGDAKPAAASTVSRTAPATSVYYDVQPRDTWWSIAERTLGDGARAGEIQKLNVGHAQADGTTVTSASAFPKAGWKLRLPADATLTPAATAHTSTPPAAKKPAAAPTRHVVVEGETLSGIALQVYGDAGRYGVIAEANHLADPDLIDPGQTLIIPAAVIDPSAAAPTRHVVVEGETLSGIAHEVYGDAGKYGVIAEANHLADPDLIDAGQTLIIPADVDQTAPVPGRPAQPDQGGAVKSAVKPPVLPLTAPQKPEPTTPHVITPAAPDRPAPAQQNTVPEVPTAAAPGAPTGAPAPTVTAPATEASATATPPATTQAPAPAPLVYEQQAAPESSNVAALIGLSGVAAAAVWTGLLLARRRGQSRRRTGRMAAVPSLPAIRVERALREAAGETDIVWLDLAMRSLAAVATASRPVPDVVWAGLTPGGLRLHLAAAAPAPAPFVADGTTWWLPRSAELPISSSAAVDQMTPLPTLTSIGVNDQGESILLDLERVGALQLIGDHDVATALLRHLLVELAHQTWSDGVEVSLVGWGVDLVALNPDRITHLPDVAAAVRALGGRVAQVAGAVADLGGVEISQARADDLAADSWKPHVLLIDAGAGQVTAEQIAALNQVLDRLSATGRVATAVIISGGSDITPAAAQLTADAGGSLYLPAGLSGQQIRAAGLTDDELHQLVNLFVAAVDVDEPIPASDTGAAWAQEMDRSGALMPAITLAEPIDITTAAGAATTIDDQDVDQQPTSAAAVLDPVAADRLQRTLAADPNLDDDLREWAADTVIRPRIAIMGTADVAAAGIEPGRRTWFTEVAVYLALNGSRGVTLERFQADLWPAKGKPGQSRPIAKTTRNETASKVRKWLGADPQNGETYVPMGTAGIYRLDGALLDVDLLQRLRKRGDARAAAGDNTGALEDYVRALQLVRGPVLPEAERGRSGEDEEVHWGWLSDAERREDLHVPGWIVDCAHRAVQVALKVDDLDQARWAASVAHLVSPYSNTTLMDLLVIAAAAGDLGAAQAHAWEVIEANEVEVPEDLPPDMCAIINRIFPAGLRWVGNS